LSESWAIALVAQLQNRPACSSFPFLAKEMCLCTDINDFSLQGDKVSSGFREDDDNYEHGNFKSFI